jgi:hypothetical protein
MIKPAPDGRALDNCIGEARVIAKQVGEACQVAGLILERLAGPSATAEGAGAGDENKPSGAVATLSQTQRETQRRLGDLLSTLEQIGRYA